ncbi:MAG: AAA family ATPase [Leptospiraceae bacterium]|nr:AAA family ATPase [Leptospiraceae bacterium]
MKQEIQGYESLELIYESRNSTIYRAIRKVDKKSIILKWVPKESNSAILSHLINEYKIAQLFQSKKVIGVYSLEKMGEGNALALEDFGAVSLKEYMDGKPLDMTNFLKIALQMCESLIDVHGKDVIHKDINPSNFVINPLDGQLKIIDFGISSLLSRTEQEIVSPERLEGTFAYISPEQTGRMNRSIDYRTDFYSLGVSFYEMLTGHCPFQAEDAMGYVHSHIAQNPKTPNQVNPEIPAVISDIIRKLLSKNAEDRYKSALGLKHDLENLQTYGFESSFKIGEKDYSTRLSIPQKLYGREKEIQTFLDAFKKMNVDGGDVSLQLVAGYSGIGKSVLVHEIHKPIIESRGYFISGKFDQFKRNIPYSAIIQAFNALIEQLLSEKKEKLETWKEKLSKVLGVNAGVIIDVIPELELIIGKQQPVPELGPMESQNRFNLTFQSFINVFTEKEHPLVLFLDDMQWADSASLNLLKNLIADSHYLFIICAYRDNEVDSTHPLIHTIEEINKKGFKIDTLTLSPLKKEDVNSLIADSLDTKEENINSLTNLVMEKTNGNPFFINEFLKTLYLEKILFFDLNQNKWIWNTEEIHKKNITDNVVDLMITRMEKLSHETRQALQLSACIGNLFDLNTVSIVSEKPSSEILKDLYQAMAQGMLVPLGETRKYIIEESEILVEQASLCFIKFQHDRIQQAAYSLIDENDKKAVHLKVGKLLLLNTSENDLEDNLFEIVGHLNYSRELISDEGERLNLASLNLRAGKKSMENAAYEIAQEFFQNCLDLLGDNRWSSNYELTMDCYLDYASSNIPLSKYQKASDLLDEALVYAKNTLEKGKVFIIKIEILSSKGEYVEAIKTGIDALKLFNINLPSLDSEEEITSSFTKEFEFYKNYIKDKHISDIYKLEINENLENIISYRIIASLYDCVVNSAPNYFGIVSILLVNLSFQKGLTSYSSLGFSFFGMTLVVLQDYKSAYQFGLLALEVSGKKIYDPVVYAKTLTTNGAFLHHLNKHFQESIELLEKSFELCLESGDLLYAAYSYANRSRRIFVASINLESTFEEFNKKKTTVLKLQNIPVFSVISALQSLPACLLKNSIQTEMDFEDFSEKVFLEQFQVAPVFIEMFLNYKVQYLFYLEYYTNAEDIIFSNEMSSLVVLPDNEEYKFFSTLVLLTRINEVNESEKNKYWKKIEENYAYIQLISKFSPKNYFCHERLVLAEMNRVKKQEVSTNLELYEEAIKQAELNEFIQYEALANELFAKFWLERGNKRYAKLHITEAHRLYAEWGAIAKVKQLAEKYPEFILLEKKIQDDGTFPKKTGTTTSAILGALDLSSIIKASQAISGEIRLESLIQKFIKIIIENAGAERCLLLIKENDELFIMAEGDTKKIETKLNAPISLKDIETNKLLCLPIIEYVERTEKAVILHNANMEGQFINDPYIKNNALKSIFCIPILQHGNRTGIIYLENNLSIGAFTEGRVEVLKILSSQAAISIENANLYSNLEEKVEERTADLQEALEKVRKLKNQQDADYFLTSLLAEPLGQSNAQSNKFKIEEFLKQKKQFQFKEKNYEIGGDINVSYNINLQNQNYIVALNGDAMGKSTQGAGGSLVLGTAFKVIIERTIKAWGSRLRPEKWLTNVYKELNDVFFFFFGLIMMSITILLIVEETEILYVLNAENPLSVLYRKGKAKFIEIEGILPKIGMKEVETDDLNIYNANQGLKN